MKMTMTMTITIKEKTTNNRVIIKNAKWLQVVKVSGFLFYFIQRNTDIWPEDMYFPYNAVEIIDIEEM